MTGAGELLGVAAISDTDTDVARRPGMAVCLAPFSADEFLSDTNATDREAGTRSEVWQVDLRVVKIPDRDPKRFMMLKLGQSSKRRGARTEALEALHCFTGKIPGSQNVRTVELCWLKRSIRCRELGTDAQQQNQAAFSREHRNFGTRVFT